MLLSEVSKGRNNNLNIIRFVAAIMVIYNHAYPLSKGMQCLDPLYHLTEGQTTFGNLAVCTFFFFSGFLISKSIQGKHPTFLQFLKARVIRIFPCLWLVVFLSVFLLGCTTTTYSLNNYLLSPETYKYFLNALLIPIHSLPGVFEKNIYGNTVNGSLWTLPVEFSCYIGCFVFWKIQLMVKSKMKYLTIVFLAMYFTFNYIVFSNNGVLLAALRACGMFYCGIFFYIYRDSINMNLCCFLLCSAGIILSSILHFYDIGLLVFLPYILSYIAFGTKNKWSKFGKNIEISYGVYLCAFPIQQIIVALRGGIPPTLNFLISLPFALLGGLLLTLFVEKLLGIKEEKGRGWRR